MTPKLHVVPGTRRDQRLAQQQAAEGHTSVTREEFRVWTQGFESGLRVLAMRLDIVERALLLKGLVVPGDLVRAIDSLKRELASMHPTEGGMPSPQPGSPVGAPIPQGGG